MVYSRRVIIAGLSGAATAAQAQRPKLKTWQPKLGVYCRYSRANLEFVRQEGFTCVQLAVEKGGLSETFTDEQIASFKSEMQRSGLLLAALGAPGNHLDPDPVARDRFNARFIKSLELAGKLGVPYVGGSSGAIPGQPFAKQIQEIVRLYEEKYFPVCEKYKVRILWEPHVNPGNIATSPVGFSALFKAFHDSPYVGLQLDPSHLVWQMIDPIECVREFVGKIFNIHLKDTEILWPVLRRVGVQALDGTRWWRFRVPGSGAIDWKGFFTALADTGYSGGMNIENEDNFYYPNYEGTDFTESFKNGYRVAHAYLKQFVPPGA
jgi:sugar phosphate isomerase/epimerase